MGEGRDLAPGCTGNYLVLVVGGGELGSSAAGGSGGGGELAPDPGGASACGEGCFSGQLPAGLLQRPASCFLPAPKGTTINDLGVGPEEIEKKRFLKVHV